MPFFKTASHGSSAISVEVAQTRISIVQIARIIVFIVRGCQSPDRYKSCRIRKVGTQNRRGFRTPKVAPRAIFACNEGQITNETPVLSASRQTRIVIVSVDLFATVRLPSPSRLPMGEAQ